MTKENQLKKLIIELRDFYETTDLRDMKSKDIEKAIELLENCENYIREED